MPATFAAAAAADAADVVLGRTYDDEDDIDGVPVESRKCLKTKTVLAMAATERKM